METGPERYCHNATDNIAATASVVSEKLRTPENCGGVLLREMLLSTSIKENMIVGLCAYLCIQSGPIAKIHAGIPKHVHHPIVVHGNDFKPFPDI